MRNLKVTKAISSCESNHRKYTYRVKGQRKYWSKAGAEGMLRILTCIKNHDLEQWLNSDFETGKLISLDRKKLQVAARDSLKRRHETHIGIQHGALATEVSGGSYLSKFNRMLNHINY